MLARVTFSLLDVTVLLDVAKWPPPLSFTKEESSDRSSGGSPALKAILLEVQGAEPVACEILGGVVATGFSSCQSWNGPVFPLPSLVPKVITCILDNLFLHHVCVVVVVNAFFNVFNG